MSKKTKTIVYSAEKSRSLGNVVLDSIEGFRDGHDLGKRLFIRDTSALYRQSILGLLWVLILPIAQTLIWVFLSKGGVLSVGDTGVPYPLFVLTGIMLWRSFVDSVNAPLMMFNSSKSILKRINFPKEALVITAFYKVLFNLSVNLIVLIPLFFYYDLSFNLQMMIGLITIIPIIMFGMAIGILITPFGALFTDVSKVLSTGLQLFFFLTPIIYPTPTEGGMGLLARYNPVAISIGTTRDFLFGRGEFIWNQYGLFLILSVILLFVGLMLYRISLPIIIERTGS